MRLLKAGARVIAVLVLAAGAVGLGCFDTGPNALGTCYRAEESQSGLTQDECMDDCPTCSWYPDRGPE
jgi:hypothetical protein